MFESNINVAVSYYTAMSEKNFEKLAQYLHPNNEKVRNWREHSAS